LREVWLIYLDRVNLFRWWAVVTMMGPRKGGTDMMCETCAELDKKIERYERAVVSVAVTVERLMAMVKDLREQKAALHPEERSKASGPL
jgi:hypothetical protein